MNELIRYENIIKLLLELENEMRLQDMEVTEIHVKGIGVEAIGLQEVLGIKIVAEKGTDYFWDNVPFELKILKPNNNE